jgi:hypothetical protein
MPTEPETWNKLDELDHPAAATEAWADRHDDLAAAWARVEAGRDGAMNLRKLLAGATPRPWAARAGITRTAIAAPTLDRPFGGTVAYLTYRSREADAALIVAAVNALPALLDALDATGRALAMLERPHKHDWRPDLVTCGIEQDAAGILRAALDKLEPSK